VTPNPATANPVSKEPSVTQTAPGPQTVTASQTSSATATGARPSNGGALAAIRNFFRSLFGSNPPRQTQGEQQKGSTPVATSTATQQTTTATKTTTKTTKAPVAPNNQPAPSNNN
jgi:hypothetical protein